MQTIAGKYTQAKVMTDVFEESVYKQVLDICNQEIFKDTNIVIMPDAHSGAGSVIGFTMPITTFIIPSIVGVDIGCGCDSYSLGKIDMSNFNYQEFDSYVKTNIPHGFNTHASSRIARSSFSDKVDSVVSKLKLKNPERMFSSIGTLGNGNHFLECGVSENGNVHLFIHSGSRNFGLQIAKYHQEKAAEFVINNKIKGVQKGLEYLLIDSKEGQDYLSDMKIAQEYAMINRDEMAKSLLRYLKPSPPALKVIKTTHNYISFEDNIVRKGAIQANLGQEVVIPFNMRDGVIIGKGKGNPDWNYSAPHGAGRVLARGEAKRKLDLKEFEETMKDVWSSCVSKDTIDESPMAYKPKEEILKYVGDTIDIIEIVKPVYNFKSTGG